MRGQRIWVRIVLAALLASAPATARAGLWEWLTTEDDAPKSLVLGEQNSVAPRPTPAKAEHGCDIYAETSEVPAEWDASRPCECCCPPSRWSARAGAIFLHRSTPSDEPLFDYGAGPTTIGSSSLRPGTTGGLDVGFTWRMDECRDVDFRFFGLDGWSTTQNYAADLVSSNALGLAFGPVVTPFSLNYRSNLYSTEANLRNWISDSFALVAGFRWMEMSEQLRADVPNVGPIMSIGTSNHLYGGQLGGVWQKDFDCFSLAVNGTAGMLGNVSRADGFGPLGERVWARDGRLAFVGDLSLTGTYRVTERISARAGYQLLWIDGVALAPNQANNLDAVGATGTVDFGGAFYHGAVVGFDVTW